MRKLLAICGLGLVLVLGGCGGDDDGGEMKTGSDLPEWMDRFGDVDVERREVEGVEVFVDEENRMIYTENCDDALRLSEEGQAFGPEPRNEDGSGGRNGYGTGCP